MVLITLGVPGGVDQQLDAARTLPALFIGVAVVALSSLTGASGDRPRIAHLGRCCAVPSVNRSYMVLFWIVVALVILALGFPLIAPWFY
ncbi:mercuric ion transporter MerT [Rubrivivax sp.]